MRIARNIARREKPVFLLWGAILAPKLAAHLAVLFDLLLEKESTPDANSSCKEEPGADEERTESAVLKDDIVAPLHRALSVLLLFHEADTKEGRYSEAF